MKHFALSICLALGVTGCTRISIDPQCPPEIEVEQTGALLARQRNPGGIPRYHWQAQPASLVRIDDPDEAQASFEALAEGNVTFTLTAADGFFQAIATCTTVIVSAEPDLDLQVALTANPTSVETGAEAPSTLLTCMRTGDTPVTTITIDQADGPPAELTEVFPGTSVAVMENEPGTYTFRCIGTDDQGNDSAPALVTVTVVEGGRPPPR